MSSSEPVLAWKRSDANRRDTRLLLILFGVVLLPAVFYVAHYLTFIVALSLMSSPGAAEAAAANPARTIGTSAVVAFIILGVIVFLEYRYAARLVLRMTDARPVTRDEEPELWRVVENLSIGTGLPQPDIRLIESDRTNAMSAGLTPEAATVAVTRGLLDLLDYREIEGALAQEIVQIGNRDTRLKTVVAALVATLWLLPMLVYRFFKLLFGLHPIIGAGCLLWFGLPLAGGFLFAIALGVEQFRTDPALGLILLGALFLPVYAFVIAPLAGLGIRAALAREREYLADADAVLLTRNPAGLRQALSKIRAEGKADLPVNPAVDHLFLVDPQADGGRVRLAFTRTHPPLDERIDLLERMGG